MNILTVWTFRTETCCVVFTNSYLRIQMLKTKSTSCFTLNFETPMTKSSFKIWTSLSLPILRSTSRHAVKPASFLTRRHRMSKLTGAIIPLLTIKILLVELTHRHPVLHHRMQIVALFVALTARAFHPKGADFLFS